MNGRSVAQKNIRSYSLAVLLIALLIFSNGCKSEDINSQWIDTPMTIDGKMDDWSNINVIYHEKEDVGLGVCNDSQNVYILFKFRDPRWLRSIRMTGVSIWIDRNGGKDKSFGIKYNGIPSSFNLEDMQRVEGSNPQSENPMRNRMNINDKVPVELRLYDTESIFKEAIIAEDGTEGPHIVCDTSMSFFTYELSIPLAESENRFYGINTSSDSKISIGFIWADMSDMKAKMGGREGGSRRGGGGGRGGSGMPGGGRGPGSMGGREQMVQKQEIWMKMYLSDGLLPKE